MLPQVPTAKPVAQYTHHVFVCLNERPPGHPRGDCGSKGAEAVLQALKEQVASAKISAHVRAQKAGCLETCEYGVSVVVYPESVWYGHVTPADAREIVQSHLVGGTPVERLRVPGK